MSDAKKLTLLLAAMAVLRAIGAASLPMVGGESYYWLWGQHLAFGYFDHPPMVAWISALFFGWVQASELAARSGPIALGLLTSLAVYRLARDLYPEGNSAWLSALLFTLTPLFHIFGSMIQPDNSLMLFMCLTWILFWRAANAPERQGLWLAAGAAAGLALMSKFHAWVMLPPLWGFLLISRQHRPALRRSGPWLAAAAALAVLSPNLIWNAHNDWMNYGFQWKRSNLSDSRFEPLNVFHYLAMPLLTLSPLLYLAALAGCWKVFRRWRALGDSRVLYLLCAGLPLVVFLGVLSLVVQISIHWPSCGYIPLIILTAALFERGEIFGLRYRRWTLGVMAALVGLTVLGAVFARHIPEEIKYPLMPKMVNTSRLRRQMIGNEEIADLAVVLRDEMQAEPPRASLPVFLPTFVMVKNYPFASLIAFYSGRYDEVFCLEKQHSHNFEIWRDEAGGLEGCNAIVVWKKEEPNKRHSRRVAKYDKYLRYLEPLFERVEPRPSLVIYPDGSTERFYGVEFERERLREFLLFKCYGFKGHLHKEEEGRFK